MAALGWIAIALVFALVWVYALYREDRHRPEPLLAVALAVVGGAGALWIAGRIEGWLMPDMGMMDESLLQRTRIAFLIAGPVEESLKLLAVLVLVWPWSHFDEPMDGIVYGAASGAGFALAENFLFMQDGPEIILSRGPIGTSVHVLFSIVWGVALGQAGHRGRRRDRFLLIGAGLIAASLLHGAFDLIVFSVGHELTLTQGRAGQIGLVIGCLLFLRVWIRAALKQHPFRWRGGRGAPPA